MQCVKSAGAGRGRPAMGSGWSQWVGREMPEAQRDFVPHATKTERQICQKNISGYKEQKSINIYLDDPLYNSCIQTDRSARTKNNAVIVSSSDGLRTVKIMAKD